MKLVKVDDLKNGVFHFEGLAVEGEILAYQKGWNDALTYVILDAPAIDAVEGVRCKDCKHMVSYEDKDWCRRHWIKTYKERYCSEGKRKHGNNAERADAREQKEAGTDQHNSEAQRTE